MTNQTNVAGPQIAGLHATTAQPLPFAPSLAARAFLLERERGNLLIYNTELLAGDLPELVERGGAQRQYLNHWHEAMFGSDAPARELGAKLLVHRDDAAQVERRGWDRPYGFSRRHALDEDFEVIPIPGHTPGATAYLWNTGAERLLFTGDTIYVHDGEWVAALLESSDRARYEQSLELLRDLDFSVLVPWAVSGDGPYAFPVAAGEARERIGAILARMKG